MSDGRMIRCNMAIFVPHGLHRAARAFPSGRRRAVVESAICRLGGISREDRTGRRRHPESAHSSWLWSLGGRAIELVQGRKRGKEGIEQKTQLLRQHQDGTGTPANGPASG